MYKSLWSYSIHLPLHTSLPIAIKCILGQIFIRFSISALSQFILTMRINSYCTSRRGLYRHGIFHKFSTI